MNIENRNKRWLKLFGTSLLSASFLFSQQSLAQDDTDENSEATAEEEVIEEVTVTGSRIKRADNMSSPIPMVSLGKQQIELTGSINVYDILNELPQAGASGLTRGNTNFTVGSSGLQGVDLRGLGLSRTLTLVNGRRWVGGIPGSSVVDLNSIPSDLIERVDVVTGGASSVYGSDAIAGVVNIILKDDYEGIDIEAMGGSYLEGDGKTHSLSITMGSNFADGRGNAIFNARIDEQGSMMARDRAPYTGRDILFYGVYLPFPPYDTYFIDPAYSSYPPQGRFFVSGVQSDETDMRTFDCSQRDEDSVLASDIVVDWAAAGGSAQCGFNRTYHRALEVPLSRYNIFAKTTFNLTEAHELFFEVSYTSVDSESEFEPVPFNSADVYGGLNNFGVHYTNPYVPQEIADAAVAANAGNAGWNGHIPFIRRLAEFGNRGSSNTRATFRVAIGTEGEFGPFDFDWYYQYGQSDRVQTSGAYNALNFRSALNAEYDALGNIVCADEVDRSAGCVPINVFGIGSISPEAVGWVGYESMRISQNTQQVIAGNISGDFDMFGLPVSFATGIEYREEFSDDNPDDLQQAGLNGSNVVPRTTGEFDVKGIYAEILVPLISDVPLIQELAFEAAYRVDDYSTAGSVTASKLGVNWTVNDQFRLRAVFAESVRAPDISDLFQGNAQTYVSITDPCAGLGDPQIEPSMDATVVSNCYQIPDVAYTAINGTYDPDLGMIVPGFIYSQPDIQTISGFIGGNQDLMEETADTMTVGLVWTPPYVEGLAMTLDYYEIKIDNVISSVSAQRLINECYASNDFPNAPQCGAHERFPGTGKIRYWYSYGINQSSYKSSGFDVAANYTLDDLIPGSLSFGLMYTNRDKHEYKTTVESDPYDYVGEVGYNEDKVKLTMVYEIGNWLISLDNTLYSSSLDDIYYKDNPDEGYPLNNLPSMYYLDLQVRYFPNDSWQIYVGLDNVTDEQPPYCPNCWNEPSPGSHYSGSQYRPWDSMFAYAGVKYSFGMN